MKRIYISLAIFGTLLPLSQFLPWVIENGLNPSLFIQHLFSNPIGGFFGFDVIVSTLVVILFITIEGKRLKMSKLWIPILGLFTVGVSLGLPLFLAMREHQKHTNIAT